MTRRYDIMTPAKAQEEEEEWRLGRSPNYKVQRVPGTNRVLYEGPSFLKNIQRRTLESRLEAMVLLQGTEFDLFIPKPLLESADSWNAAKGKPDHYPKGRSRGTIGSPDDPKFKMDPGTEIYFQGLEDKKTPLYVDFSTLEVEEEETPKNKTQIFIDQALSKYDLKDLRSATFRKKHRITSWRQRNSSMFAKTSKMGAASWSVMAGSPQLGGTCLATDLYQKEASYNHNVLSIPESRISHTAPDQNKWICSYCYAGKANYIYRNVQWVEVARWVWMAGMLKDSFEDTFETLKLALKCHLSNINQRKANNENPEFFRIHDSGDFSNVGSLNTYELWRRIAADPAFRKIHFWAPTRMWAYPYFRDLVKKFPPSKNFTVRPSALHVDDKAPMLESFTPGTTVHASPKKKSNFTKKQGIKNLVIQGTPKDPGEKIADWECPAYRNTYIENACTGAGGPQGQYDCRVCWLYPEWTVSYKAH